MKELLLSREYLKLMKSANKYRNWNISLYIRTLVKMIALREMLMKNRDRLQIG